MGLKVVTRQAGRILIAVLLLTGVGLGGGLAPLVARAGAATSPISGETAAGSLAALLGQTAGLIADGNQMATPEANPTPSAQLVVVLSTINPDAAETAATVIAQRLAIGRTSPLMSGEMADRSWTELFLRRKVRAVSEEPAVLIELMPAPGVRPFILQEMLFQGMPGFLAWEW